ncbi:hypothetical protein K1719_009054 [Acacia pycnantha]|nr:hypothetical protein K1719_009054 [Acacia pycnantha]
MYCNPYANLGDKDKDMSPALAESPCCQGVDLLTGCDRLGSSGGKCCSHINVQQLHADSENLTVALVSGTTKTGNTEQGVDVLVPLCQGGPNSLCISNEGACVGLHPLAMAAQLAQLVSASTEEDLLGGLQTLSATLVQDPLLQVEGLVRQGLIKYSGKESKFIDLDGHSFFGNKNGHIYRAGKLFPVTFKTKNQKVGQLELRRSDLTDFWDLFNKGDRSRVLNINATNRISNKRYSCIMVVVKTEDLNFGAERC